MTASRRTLGDPAARLTARGLYVFPALRKTPLTEHGFHDAVGTPEEARALFARHPGATGIGVDCGRSELLVVDLDGSDAAQAWERLLERHGPVASLEVSTGRHGGCHVWFRTRDPRSRNSAGKVAPHVDTRGAGGFVLAPPSLHPSGRRYEWRNREPIRLAPQWLLAMLAPPATPESGERRSLPPGARCTSYGRTALEGLTDDMLATPEGGRNDRLVRLAYRAGRLEAAGEIHETVAEAVLIEAALRAGLGFTEATRTFRSGFEAGRQSPAARATR